MANGLRLGLDIRSRIEGGQLIVPSITNATGDITLWLWFSLIWIDCSGDLRYHGCCRGGKNSKSNRCGLKFDFVLLSYPLYLRYSPRARLSISFH